MRTKLLFPYIRAVVLAGLIAIVALICMVGTAQANQGVGDVYAKEVSDTFGFSLATADASGDDILLTFDSTTTQFGTGSHVAAPAEISGDEIVLAANVAADDALTPTCLADAVELFEPAIVSYELKEDTAGDIVGRGSRIDYKYLA